MRDVRMCVAAAALPVMLVAGCASGVRQHSSAGALYDMLAVEYNSATDTTRVHTAVMPVTPTMSMYAAFRFAGEVLHAQPAEVRLVFEETSALARWERPQGRTLELRLDDTARVTIDSTQYQRRVVAARGPVTAKVIEWVWAGVPFETFERLAAAKHVDVRLGTTHFALKQEHLEALRQLAQRVAPTLPAPAASRAGAPQGS